TALCLRWLDANPPKDQTVVDYGCGSGILGIAALLLGAKQAYGVDLDPQALQATAENCGKNSLDPERFPVFLPKHFPATTRGQADGVLANILAGTLIALAEDLCSQPKSGGWMLLSGILREQADSVIEAFHPWCRDFNVA